MAVQDSRICCCGASTWTKVFAWLQIIGGVLLIIVSGVIIAALSSDTAKNDPDIDQDDRKLALAVSCVILVVYIFDFVLGILLLIGTTREKPVYLMMWIIITGVTAVVNVIMGIIDATAGNAAQIVIIIIQALIYAFLIWVVRRRMQDIKLGGSGGGVGA